MEEKYSGKVNTLESVKKDKFEETVQIVDLCADEKKAPLVSNAFLLGTMTSSFDHSFESSRRNMIASKSQLALGKSKMNSAIVPKRKNYPALTTLYSKNMP